MSGNIPITHTLVSTIADNSSDAAAGKVVPSNWNDTHQITGLLPQQFMPGPLSLLASAMAGAL